MLRLLATVLALAWLVAGCGGEERAAPGSADNPLQAVTPADEGDGAARANEAAAAPDGKPPAEGKAQAPGYEALVERQTSKPTSRFSPCNLVGHAQASAIVGKPLRAPVEAPQGPTCIYQARRGDGFVTLALQQTRFAQLKRQVRRPQTIPVAGRTAVCGRHGGSVLYLPVAGGRVLSVAAPCDVATGFARAAAPRVNG